ncbi:MAG: hypothetical protein ACLUI3_06915 [Christensenellales bacterium]
MENAEGWHAEGVTEKSSPYAPYCYFRDLPLRGTFSIVAACGGFRRWKTPKVGTPKA